MRTGTSLWMALVVCTLTLTLPGCKMQLSPTSTTKVWCCATCPGYTKPAIQVAFLDHRGDGIPKRRIYITDGGPALAYARDAEGAPLPRDNAHGWVYVVTGEDGKAAVSFEMPPNFDTAPTLVGVHSFKFLTYLDELREAKPQATRELKVTVAGSCE